MGIFDRFRSERQPEEASPRVEPVLGPASQATVAPRALGDVEHFDGLKDPRLTTFLRGGSETDSGAVVTPQTAMTVSAVYGCVRLISGAVATMPLDVKRRVDQNTREDAADHALWRVLRRRPNGWMKPAQYKRMATMQVLLEGNAYALIVRNSRDEITDLLPLNPRTTKVTQLDDLSLVYEYIQKNGRKVTLPQEDVFHLMGMTFDGIKGVSVLAYARETVGLAQATRRHGAEFFRNGTQVGSVLSHPHTLGDEGQTNLRESLEEFRSRRSRAQATLILEEGMKFERIGMTAHDAQFIQTMGLTRTDIGMFFGVPPHMLGDTEKSTSWGEGIEAQKTGFVAFTLEDWLTAWEEGVNGDLVGADEPTIYARFNRASIVRGDFETRWEGYVKGLQWGVYSPDDVRALEDENARPDGKGGIYYDPPNTAGQSGKADGENKDDDPPTP